MEKKSESQMKIDVKHGQVLFIEPNDVILVHTEYALDSESVDKEKKKINGVFPEHKLLFFMSGTELSIARSTDGEARKQE